MNFDEAAQYLHGLTRLGIKLGNDRFEALLDRLGKPHLGLRVIHVAGTKGKGSTAMFASSVLRAAGHKVGTYLSPYVYDLRERIQIGGEMIPREDMARLATRIRAESELLSRDRPDLGPTTEFEFKTALGFVYFAEQAVDYAVVEVGIGGRLDATNVIPRSLVSVITNIGYDHMQILGDTLSLIAGEKSGIIKTAGVCVTGAQDPEALSTITRVAAERGAKLVHVRPNADWAVAVDGSLGVRTRCRRLSGLRLGAIGGFQYANAALAVHALDSAEPAIVIDDAAIRTGLASARMPGRFEIVRTDSPTVIVDAAHNEMAAEALSDALRRELGAEQRPLVLVVGMSKGHETGEFLQSLVQGFNPFNITLIATEPPFRPRAVADVALAAREVGISRVELVTPVIGAAERAVDAALQLGERAIVVVTGSFFTIGEVSPPRWRDIFEARGLNVRIPADILRTEEQVTL